VSTEKPNLDGSREIDILLWGATGFTGGLVAEYLVTHLSRTPIRLALGGRNREKLEAVRRSLLSIEPKAADLPIFVADSRDLAALTSIVARTRVVCTTVGPYARFGHELVEACASQGSHYCDLTGEVQFIRAMIDKHHERAQKTGARIVHCCGFDSIPSDLGTWMMNETMVNDHGAQLEEVKLVLGPSRGGFSGGTVASMMNLVEQARTDQNIRRLVADPYALNPEAHRNGPDGPDQIGARFDPRLRCWTGPFVMASINTRVVRRSNALMGSRYGRDFRYSEVAGFGPGLRGRLAAIAMAGALGAFLAAASLGPTRTLLRQTVLPSPGEGPGEKARESGFFNLKLHAFAKAGNGSDLRRVGKVEGTSDPGYGSTAKMLGESALCLAFDTLPIGGGVLTPASAMGATLIERLRSIGMIFEVEAL